MPATPAKSYAVAAQTANRQALWSPSAAQIAKTHLAPFMLFLEKQTASLPDYQYHTLYRLSIDQPELFWETL